MQFRSAHPFGCRAAAAPPPFVEQVPGA